jgi:hypothetical protein
MPNDWRFILAATPAVGSPPGSPLERIGELDQLRGRENDFGLNRSGSAKGTLPLIDEMAYQIFIGEPRRGTLRRSLITMRGSDTIWSGPIVTLDGSAPEMVMNIGAVGWFELLNYRELRRNLNFIGNNPLTGMPWTDMEIAFELLDEANEQEPDYPTFISRGVMHGVGQARERKYTKGSKIGPLIHELSTIENGFDYQVDPISRELNLYGAGGTLGTDRPEAHFGYYLGPSNIDRFNFAEDGFSVRNYMTAYGNPGVTPGQAIDRESMGAFGIFEETANLTNVANSGILAAYAGAEVAVNALPRITYTISPFPWRSDLPIPRFKQDYDIGDFGRFSVNAGAVSVYGQHVRFYGATASITDEGVERITKLDISPS